MPPWPPSLRRPRHPPLCPLDLPLPSARGRSASPRWSWMPRTLGTGSKAGTRALSFSVILSRQQSDLPSVSSSPEIALPNTPTDLHVAKPFPSSQSPTSAWPSAFSTIDQVSILKFPPFVWTEPPNAIQQQMQVGFSSTLQITPSAALLSPPDSK